MGVFQTKESMSTAWYMPAIYSDIIVRESYNIDVDRKKRSHPSYAIFLDTIRREEDMFGYVGRNYSW